MPKTIDNDLDLPPHIDTFGYQTARHLGVEIVENLVVDAKTTSRWYFVIAMGRKAGHLALGIGKAAGATLTLITEEFPTPIRLKTVVDTLVGAIIKRLAEGRKYGVAVIAEGVSLDIDPKDFAEMKDVERDAHGHIRLAEVNLGEMLKKQVSARLQSLGIKTTIAEKNIGYELAVRRSDSVRYRVHARPGLLRREVPDRRRQRRDDLAAGRPFRAGAVLRDDRQRDRPHARAAGRRRRPRATPSRGGT